MDAFDDFAAALRKNLAALGYREAGGNADAASFAFAKEENAGLCLFHIADASRLDAAELSEERESQMEKAAALAPMYRGVMAVFLYAEAGEPRVYFEGEGYFGQSPYAVNWYLDMETGELSAPAGQPSDVYGLRREIISALAGSHDAAPILYTVRCPTAYMTFALAAVNAVVLLMMYNAGYSANPAAVAVRFGAIMPARVWDGEYYRLFTAMFVHFGWTHLLFNLTGLFIFGTRVERYYGRALFLAIYLLTGLCASLTSLFLTNTTAAGASGAIYGLVGAVFAYTRKSRGHMDGLNNYVALVYIIMGVALGFAMPGVDYYAHAGGLAAGVAFGFAALALFWRKAARG
jgi:membrane associated rhomboid family serine protease